MRRLFKKNIGKRGRIFRFFIAVVLLGAAYYYSSLGLLLGSLFVFFEACMSWCIVMQLFGKSSCRIKKK